MWRQGVVQSEQASRYLTTWSLVQVRLLDGSGQLICATTSWAATSVHSPPHNAKRQHFFSSNHLSLTFEIMGSWQVECPDNNISWWKRQIWWEEGCSSEFHFPESVEPVSSGGSMYTSTRSTTMSMYTAGTNNITSFVTNWSGNKLKLKSWHEFFCFNNSHTPRVLFYANGKIKMVQLGSMLYFVLRTATPVTTPNS